MPSACKRSGFHCHDRDASCPEDASRGGKFGAPRRKAPIVTGRDTEVRVLGTVLGGVAGYRMIVVKDGLYSSLGKKHEASMGVHRRRYRQQVGLVETDPRLEAWREEASGTGAFRRR